MDDNKKNRPVHTERMRGLYAAIFANTAKESSQPYYKVTLQRTYMDGDEHKTTYSLSRDDLPIAQLLLQRSWVWIIDQEVADRKSESEEGK